MADLHVKKHGGFAQGFDPLKEMDTHTHTDILTHSNNIQKEREVTVGGRRRLRTAKIEQDRSCLIPQDMATLDNTGLQSF